MGRLAASAPKLEIFGDAFVLRDDRGWAITDSGRRFLASLETPMPASAEQNEQPSATPPVVTSSPLKQPALPVVDNTLTAKSGPSLDGNTADRLREVRGALQALANRIAAREIVPTGISISLSRTAGRSGGYTRLEFIPGRERGR